MDRELSGSCGCSASPAGTCVQDDVVLQSEHLVGDLVFVVPQLESSAGGLGS